MGTDVTLIIDDASVELFADKGATTMTSIFFPTETYGLLKITGGNHFKMDTVSFTFLKSIWKKK